MSDKGSRQIRKLEDTVQSLEERLNQLTAGEVILQETREISFSQWKGPIPSPDTIREYEAIQPGMGKALVQEFLAEADFRRDLTRKDQEFATKYYGNSMRAVNIGLGVASTALVACLAIVIWLIVLSQFLYAILLFGGIAALTAVFVRKPQVPEGPQPPADLTPSESK